MHPPFHHRVDTLGSYMYVGRVLETVTLLQRCLRSKRNNTIVVLHVHVYLYLHVNFGLHERVVINRNLDFVPVNLINNLHRIKVRQISLFSNHSPFIKHMMFYYLSCLLCWIRHGENKNTILKHRPLVSPPAK